MLRLDLRGVVLNVENIMLAALSPLSWAAFRAGVRSCRLASKHPSSEALQEPPLVLHSSAASSLPQLPQTHRHNEQLSGSFGTDYKQIAGGTEKGGYTTGPEGPGKVTLTAELVGAAAARSDVVFRLVIDIRNIIYLPDCFY